MVLVYFIYFKALLRVLVHQLLVRRNIWFSFDYDFLYLKGAMRDEFSNFSQPYFIFDRRIILSGIILFPMPILKWRKERRQKLTKH
jgi:hypothetical protein